MSNSTFAEVFSTDACSQELQSVLVSIMDSFCFVYTFRLNKNDSGFKIIFK